MIKRLVCIVLSMILMLATVGTATFAADESNPLDSFFPTTDKAIYVTENLQNTCNGSSVTYSGGTPYVSSDGTVTLPQDYTDVTVTATVGGYSKAYSLVLTPKGAVTYLNDGFENSSGAFTKDTPNGGWTKTDSYTSNTNEIISDTNRGNYLYMTTKTKDEYGIIARSYNQTALSENMNSGDYITYMVFDYKRDSGYNKLALTSPLISGINYSGSQDRINLNAYTKGVLYVQAEDFKNIRSGNWCKIAAVADTTNFYMLVDGKKVENFYVNSDLSADSKKSGLVPNTRLGNEFEIKFGSAGGTFVQSLDNILVQTITKQQIAENAVQSLSFEQPLVGGGALPTETDGGFGKTVELTWASDNESVIENDGTINTPAVETQVGLTLTGTVDGKSATREITVTVSAASEAQAIVNNDFNTLTTNETSIDGSVEYSGLTLTGSSYVGVDKSSLGFGYDNVLKVSGSNASLSKTFTAENNLSIQMDIEAVAGAGVSLQKADGSELAKLEFDGNGEIKLTGATDNAGTYVNGQWHRLRFDALGGKLTTYIDGTKVKEITLEKPSKLVISGTSTGFSVDNLKILDVKVNAQIPDNLELMNEIQYAKDLTNYYDTQIMSGQPVAYWYFVDYKKNDQYTYYGDTEYKAYKAAITSAENVYKTELSDAAYTKAVEEMLKHIKGVGGEIREVNFENGRNYSYTGLAGLVTEKPAVLNNVLKIETSGSVLFAPVEIGASNFAKHGDVSFLDASVDFKAGSGMEIGIGNETNNVIRLKSDGANLQYYNGSQWTTIKSDMIQGQWYSLYVAITIANNDYNGTFRVYLDGTELAKNIALINNTGDVVADRINFVKGSGDERIDNVVITFSPEVAPSDAQKPSSYRSGTYRGDKGKLAKALRDGYGILEQYKDMCGTQPGYCTEESYTALEKACAEALANYNRKAFKISSNWNWNSAIDGYTEPVTTAIAGISIVPFKDWEILSIEYKNAAGDTVYSPVKGGTVSKIRYRRYAETAEEGTRLYVAVFDGDKVFKDVSIVSLADAQIGTVIEAPLNLKIDADNPKVRCFAFSPSLVPLTYLENKVLNNNVSLYVCGDSTYAAYDRANLTGSSASKYGIGEKLADYLSTSNVSVVNMAKSGYTTQMCKDSVWGTVMSDIKAGDYVLVAFGHNDQKADSNKYVAPEEYKKNLRYFAESARSKGAEVILVTPAARLQKSTDTDEDIKKSVQAHKDYSAYCEAVGAELNVPVVDLYAITQNLVDNQYDTVKANYIVGAHPASGDYTHFTQTGASAYAKLIAQELIKLEHPLKKYITVD